jgi:hypothetical protein
VFIVGGRPFTGGMTAGAEEALSSMKAGEHYATKRLVCALRVGRACVARRDLEADDKHVQVAGGAWSCLPLWGLVPAAACCAPPSMCLIRKVSSAQTRYSHTNSNYSE